MPPIPYISTRNREVQDHYKQESFRKLAQSKPHTITYAKHSTQAGVASFGDALPTFAAAFAIDAILQDPPKEEKVEAWGTDLRQVIVIYVLAQDAAVWGLTNKDRFTVDGVIHEIVALDEPEGMGHEEITRKVTLSRQSQTV